MPNNKSFLLPSLSKWYKQAYIIHKKIVLTYMVPINDHQEINLITARKKTSEKRDGEAQRDC